MNIRVWIGDYVKGSFVFNGMKNVLCGCCINVWYWDGGYGLDVYFCI